MLRKYILALLLSCGLLAVVMLATPMQKNSNRRNKREDQRAQCLRACGSNYNSEKAACQSRPWNQREACQREATGNYIRCRASCPPY